MASTRLGYLAVIKENTRGTARKPNKFVRFKEGDILYGQEIIENNPIQNNRWNAINAVQGKVDTNGSYKLDVDPSEVVRWLMVALGQISSADAGTPTDGTVYQHTIDHACRVGSLTLEQAKGELCDDPLTLNGQKYQVGRAFGCMVDSFKISGGDGILEGEVSVKAYGLFETAKLITNESVEGTAKTITGITWANGIATVTATSHGLAINNLVNITGVTPAGYNGGYRVLSVPTANTFTVALATNPGAWTSGGTATKLAQFFFDNVEGVVAGDSGKLVETVGGTYENVTVVAVDVSTQSIGFTSVTSTAFTVANKAKFELLPQTPSYQTARVNSFVDVKFRTGDTVALAQTADPQNVENWEINYMNNLEERYGSLRKSPSVIGEKGAKATIKYEKYFENVADRDAYRNQIKSAMICTISNNEIVSATDTTQGKYTIQFEFSDIRFTSYEMPTGTDELYVLAIEATAFYDNTDGRALRIKVKNQNSGTYYTA